VTFWQVVWASALGYTVASVAMAVGSRVALLIVKGIDAEEKP